MFKFINWASFYGEKHPFFLRAAKLLKKLQGSNGKKAGIAAILMQQKIGGCS